eukprot:3368608-Prymnesium_polylepis.1
MLYSDRTPLRGLKLKKPEKPPSTSSTPEIVDRSFIVRCGLDLAAATILAAFSRAAVTLSWTLLIGRGAPRCARRGGSIGSG